MDTLTPAEYWSKIVNNSEFCLRLFTASAPIISRHSKEFLKDPSKQSFEAIGSQHERLLKSLVNRIGQLSSYFDDVFLTLTFLEVDKSRIADLYGDAMEPEQYYKFHYDNYLIRMVTSLDICAKFGNILYELKVPEKDMYPVRFYRHSRLKNELAGQVLKDFADYFDQIKQDRHRKVHQRASQENKFDRVLFWENINKALGKTPEEQDPVLEELTITQISEVLSDIQTTTRESVTYVGGFLKSCLPQLNAILSRSERN